MRSGRLEEFSSQSPIRRAAQADTDNGTITSPTFLEKPKILHASIRPWTRGPDSSSSEAVIWTHRRGVEIQPSPRVEFDDRAS
jgi:hypothetical protein